MDALHTLATGQIDIGRHRCVIEVERLHTRAQAASARRQNTACIILGVHVYAWDSLACALSEQRSKQRPRS